MGSIAQSVALGIAGGFAAKVIHSAIEEADLNKSNCLTGEAENFVSEQLGEDDDAEEERPLHDVVAVGERPGGRVGARKNISGAWRDLLP